MTVSLLTCMRRSQATSSAPERETIAIVPAPQHGQFAMLSSR